MSSEAGGGYEVDDPDEFNQKRRIKDLLDVRTNVIDVKRDIRQAILMGHIDEQTGNHALRDAVQDLIYEVEPIAKGHEKQLQYWGGMVDEDNNPIHEDGLGNLVVERDGEEYAYDDDPYWTGPHLGVMRLPDGGVKEFYGLGDIVRTPDPMVVEWEEPTEDEYDGEDAEMQREVVQIPQDVLMTAFRTTNAFLFEIGLGLDESAGELPHDKI